MKVSKFMKPAKQVRLRDLEYGDGFIDGVGDPYVLLDPNTGCFGIKYLNPVLPTKIMVLAYSNKYKPILGHLDGNDLVTPVDTEIIFTERK